MSNSVPVLNKVFYFDLEETLIDSFNKPDFCNQEKIELFIERNNVKEVGIFSAAIYGIRDKDHFVKYIKEGLEKRYNIKIVNNRIVMLQQLIDQFMFHDSLSIDVSEMLSIYGKDGVFHKYCRMMYETNKHCILLDDAFDDQIFNNTKKSLISEIVNIENYR